MIGKTVSHFKILSKLGAGGMGEVYLAEDTALARKVALKFLAPQYTADSELEARFKREAKAAAALNHPNIVVVHEVGEHEGQTYIAMEYVEGQSLRDRIVQGALPVEEVLNIVSQICEGLQKAHEAGIVHRDLKPENILIDKDGRVRIVDFGLARLGDATKLTRESSTLGTLHYISPEQVQGQEVDHRADIWAFGVLLYEMLTGKVPFAGDYPAAVMYSVINEEPEALKTHLQFQSLLDTALSKSMESRFQQVSDLLAQLKSLQQPTTAAHESVPIKSGVRFKPAWLFSGFMVLLIAIVLILWRIGAKDETSSSFQQMQITRLSNTGNVQEAAISPDGKYVVMEISEGGKNSLWLRQMDTGSKIRIIEPDYVSYQGLRFSPDASFVYYGLFDQAKSNGALYRIPVLGGRALKLVSNVGAGGFTEITFSPDGEQMAFVRKEGPVTKLITASIDGSEQRVIATKERPMGFSPVGYSWAPDGRSIAIVSFSYDAEGQYRIPIVEISLENGEEKVIVKHTEQEWIRTFTLAWLPDGSGLVFAGAGKPGNVDNVQIWHISYPSGKVQRITNDLNDYRYFSLTADAKTLVMVQERQQGDIYVTSTEKLDQGKIIASVLASRHELSVGLSWSTKGEIVYTATEGKSTDIWVMQKDGSEKRQITSHANNDYWPQASPDGLFITFASGFGNSDLWRIDMDGSNRKKLVSGLRDGQASFTPDGAWVLFSIYHPNREEKYSLYKVSSTGGTPVKLRDGVTDPVISPDGKQIAGFFWEDSLKSFQIVLLPFDGSEPDRFLNIPLTRKSSIQWSPDSKALIYSKTENGVMNLWRHPLDGSSPEQITHFTEGEIWAFAYSRDGKYLAYTRGRTDSDAILISNFR
ncbi:protein kinase [candidate division KSB1 bacterium]|nr:protein kinase [candidate division KSB1 bacterium]